MTKVATKVIRSVDQLPVMEAFHSIQGEGYHQGKSAYFIRLGGCDVGCHWCDVKDSWNADNHPSWVVGDLVKEVKNHESKMVIITGGEPLMHNLDLITSSLQSEGYQTHIETSGVHSISGIWDWICFSPKKFKSPKPEIYEAADELKVVIYNNADFLWAEQHAERVGAKCKLYLQPEWSKREIVMPKIVDYIKKNPKWSMSLQIHKYLGVR